MWDTNTAPPMFTDSKSYPRWQSEVPVIINETQKVVEYKYIIKDGNRVIWEDGQNRQVNLLDFLGKNFQGKVLVIEDHEFSQTQQRNQISFKQVENSSTASADEQKKQYKQKQTVSEQNAAFDQVLNQLEMDSINQELVLESEEDEESSEYLEEQADTL